MAVVSSDRIEHAFRVALGVKAQKKAPLVGAFGMRSEEWQHHCRQAVAGSAQKSEQCLDA